MIEIYNNQNIKLKDLIHLEKSIIPIDTCNLIIDNIEKKDWIKHKWSNIHTKLAYTNTEDNSELDMQECDSKLHQILSPYVIKSLLNYSEKYFFNSDNTKDLVTKFSTIRFNRYKPGQMMKQHCDHIISLFEGNERGIPVLSVILNLNSDYNGGDLCFWEDHIIKLGVGDIVVFPSLFLFPHKITTIIDGTRYSAVSWAW